MSDAPELLPFDLMTVLRTPYRIDIVQPVYFEIDSFAQLAQAIHGDLPEALAQAAAMGDLPARFEMAA
jgi:phenylalanine-4-hydroxylase